MTNNKTTTQDKIFAAAFYVGLAVFVIGVIAVFAEFNVPTPFKPFFIGETTYYWTYANWLTLLGLIVAAVTIANRPKPKKKIVKLRLGMTALMILIILILTFVTAVPLFSLNDNDNPYATPPPGGGGFGPTNPPYPTYPPQTTSPTPTATEPPAIPRLSISSRSDYAWVNDEITITVYSSVPNIQVMLTWWAGGGGGNVLGYNGATPRIQTLSGSGHIQPVIVGNMQLVDIDENGYGSVIVQFANPGDETFHAYYSVNGQTLAESNYLTIPIYTVY